MPPDLPNEPPPFLDCPSAMAARIARFDWSPTPLGPLAEWPDALQVPVGMVLRSQLPMAILWGVQGVLIYNDAYAEFAGQRHPQVLGECVRQAWPEAAAFHDSVLQCVLGGDALVCPEQEFLLTRQGQAEPVWINLNYSPLVDATGRPAGALALVLDISASVRARRNLIAERERFAKLFEQSPSFMAMLEGPDHRITLANPSYLKLVGHRPLLGRTMAEAMPDAVEQGYVELLDAVFSTGEPFSTYGSLYEVQAQPGGPVDERYVDIVFQPIRDAAGEVSGVFVEGVDVTERMVAELRREGLAVFTNALRSLESVDEISHAAATLLGRTLKVGRAGYGTVDAVRETLTVARDWTLPGVASRAGTLQLRDYGSFVEDLKRDEFVQVDDMRTDPRTGCATEALAARGSVAFMLVPVTERGELVAVLFVIQAEARRWMPEDVGFMREVGGRTRTAVERARSQQALREANESLEARIQERTRELMDVEAKLRQAQKMEAIGQLTGGIAHDFNNLLGSMSVSLQVLEKRVAAQKLDGLERYTGMAQESLRRAASLTQRLLAFSRRQTLDPRPCDVNRLIVGIEDLVRRTVGPSVDVEVVVADGLWATRIDASQLENALLNLCINARDAMAPHGGRLTLETANEWIDEATAAEREMAVGAHVAVCVTDTGAGMSREVAERAFDPFFTTKPLGQGTGLGLSMVYGFVRQSGGQVRIESEPGQGTRLCLLLPRFVGEAPPEDAAPPVFGPTASGAGEVVLLIEDEATIRQLVAEQLQDAGYTVVAAADGPSGLRLLQTGQRVDLLLTDVGLPGGLNGRQVADAARVDRAGLKVLFITGYAESAAVGDGLLAHGMEVITKPFDVAALVRKVRLMLDRPD
ncbi:PAS domain-containing protein [Xylophilus sp. Kf1]|nr:PAS domain-containing protein [Xylophilus sp. Kf1]